MIELVESAYNCTSFQNQSKQHSGGQQYKEGKELMKILRKTPSESTSTPQETGQFRKSRFSVETQQAQKSSEEQELPDLQALQDRSDRFRQKLSQMKVHGNRPVIQPKLFGQQGTEYQQGNSLVSQQFQGQAAEIEAASPQPRQLQTNSLQRQSQPQEEEESPVPAQAESTQLQGQAQEVQLEQDLRNCHSDRWRQHGLDDIERAGRLSCSIR